jgi:hypothetical protein
VESKSEDKFRRANDPVRKMYDKAYWRRFERFVLARNQICQKIENGVQCICGASIVHHLISPRARPDLFLDVRNVVALCERHHPGGEAGTPEWKEGRDFVASVISSATCV